MRSNDIIAIEELTKARTTAGLFRYVKETLNTINENEIERKKFRLDKGLYKYLRHEIYDLAHFAVQKFSVAHEIKPVIGNQGHDAEVYFKGKLVEKIEVSWAIDGKEDHNISVALNEKGFTKPTTQLKNIQEVNKNRCLLNMRKKATKDYTDCSLLVVFDTAPGFDPEDNENSKVINELLNEAKKINFKAKKVYLMTPAGSIQKNSEPSKEFTAKIFEIK